MVGVTVVGRDLVLITVGSIPLGFVKLALNHLLH